MSAILTNPASSNHLYKINSVTLSNKLTINTSVDLALTSASNDYYFAKSVVIPASSSLILVGKENSIYLEEGSVLKGKAFHTGSLDVIVGYEDLS